MGLLDATGSVVGLLLSLLVCDLFSGHLGSGSLSCSLLSSCHGWSDEFNFISNRDSHPYIVAAPGQFTNY